MFMDWVKNVGTTKKNSWNWFFTKSRLASAYNGTFICSLGIELNWFNPSVYRHVIGDIEEVWKLGEGCNFPNCCLLNSSTRFTASTYSAVILVIKYPSHTLAKCSLSRHITVDDHNRLPGLFFGFTKCFHPIRLYGAVDTDTM